LVSACASGESCKPPPTPQPDLFGAPASGTFSGPGNVAPVAAVPVRAGKTVAQLRAEKLAKALKACRKKKAKKKRLACERGARKRYGTAKATKTKKAAKASEKLGAGR
jgi:uncharacterized protein YaiL (DUF2058 family)